MIFDIDVLSNILLEQQSKCIEIYNITQMQYLRGVQCTLGDPKIQVGIILHTNKKYYTVQQVYISKHQPIGRTTHLCLPHLAKCLNANASASLPHIASVPPPTPMNLNTCSHSYELKLKCVCMLHSFMGLVSYFMTPCSSLFF